MIQSRRIGALCLGLWMGAAIFCDVAATQNFSTVDTFLESPGSPKSSLDVKEVGRDRVRFLLRRNAAEENATIFENWERTQLCIGAGLFMLLLFGDRPSKLMLVLSILMILAVCAQRFYYGPAIASLGRGLADLPPSDPLHAGFGLYHGIYGGIEILKLLLGAVLALRLSVRTKGGKDLFAKEYELQEGGGDQLRNRRARD